MVKQSNESQFHLTPKYKKL